MHTCPQGTQTVVRSFSVHMIQYNGIDSDPATGEVVVPLVFVGFDVVMNNSERNRKITLCISGAFVTANLFFRIIAMIFALVVISSSLSQKERERR
mmetsp:Transcript_13743/g.20319  ORF Transcript_13743/g.20319 Transcript_13743/m.20319 type:complete len:96 (+) Transcript_13743:709-996(+)